MSVARVYTSRFAGRLGATLKCGKCGSAIQKGESYRWYKVGFRSRYKNVRCNRGACTPRQSELESSKLAGVYSAQETANEAIAAIGFEPEYMGSAADWSAFVDGLKSALQSAAEEVRTVADEYRDAADSMGSAGSEMEEKADTLESSADELENWDPSEDEPQPCDEHEEFNVDCEECLANAESWWEDISSEAVSAIDEMEMPY